jgi:cell division protein ZapA
MNTAVKSLEVSIMGRDFRISCPADQEEALMESVAYLDRRMQEIRESGKVIGVERIAIMAALNITHEFLSSHLSGSFDVGEFKRRMKEMEGQLDLALASQDALF